MRGRRVASPIARGWSALLAALAALLVLLPRTALAAPLKLWHAYRGDEEKALLEILKGFQGAKIEPLALPADFEVFPPEVSASSQPFGPGLSGEKTFEYVLIPRAPGSRRIPAITMGYFDEREGAYRTASTRPLALTVSGVMLKIFYLFGGRVRP